MGLRINAYAKINLSLEVIGRRDDGYHEIATILQTVDLADTVTLRTGDGLTVECDDASLSGEGNIVWRAPWRWRITRALRRMFTSRLRNAYRWRPGWAEVQRTRRRLCAG